MISSNVLSSVGLPPKPVPKITEGMDEIRGWICPISTMKSQRSSSKVVHRSQCQDWSQPHPHINLGGEKHPGLWPGENQRHSQLLTKDSDKAVCFHIPIPEIHPTSHYPVLQSGAFLMQIATQMCPEKQMAPAEKGRRNTRTSTRPQSS